MLRNTSIHADEHKKDDTHAQVCLEATTEPQTDLLYQEHTHRVSLQTIVDHQIALIKHTHKKQAQEVQMEPHRFVISQRTHKGTKNERKKMWETERGI